MFDYESFKKDLKTLIAIKSVKEKNTSDAPFGKGIKQVLLEFLSIAEKMQFKVINYDNYAGEVILGEGEEIGIIGHLDVVPEGEGWKTLPYKLIKKNRKFIGRGISDDKAPMLLCLYALKELKESKNKLNKKFRLIVGCDEESGWKDVEYLKTKTILPEYGFSPDGNFPVSYAEKGMAEIEFSFPKFNNFYDIKGGTVVNAVCGYAEAIPKIFINEKLLKTFGLSMQNGKIISVGKSVHGSTPQKGKNAFLPLLNLIFACGENIQHVIDCLFNDKYSLTKQKNEQGNITLSPDLIKEENGNIFITCDLRVPAPFTFKTATDIIDKFQIPYKIKIRHEPTITDKESELIKTLSASYEKITGKSGTPVSLSGSTFARAFKNGCSFGPEFPRGKGTAHEPNESISEKNLLLMYDIYKEAIFGLNK